MIYLVQNLQTQLLRFNHTNNNNPSTNNKNNVIGSNNIGTGWVNKSLSPPLNGLPSLSFPDDLVKKEDLMEIDDEIEA